MNLVAARRTVLVLLSFAALAVPARAGECVPEWTRA